MKIIGILLILVGVVAIFSSTIGFGDIGLAFLFIGIVSILSGIGFMLVPKRRKKPRPMKKPAENED